MWRASGRLESRKTEAQRARGCCEWQQQGGDFPRWNSTLLGLYGRLLLSVLVSVKVFFDKNSSTMLVFLPFKLWSKSNLVNSVSPWPGGSYIHMSNVSECLTQTRLL